MKVNVCSVLLFLTPLLTQVTARVARQDSLPFRTKGSTFDYTRIKDHPDKKLLSYIVKYFDAFTGADFAGIEALQDDSYTMTDIRKSHPLNSYPISSPPWAKTNPLSALSPSPENVLAPFRPLIQLALAVIRAPKPVWNEINAGFTNLLTNLSVEALTLYGSTEPGAFSLMEHVVWAQLAVDPPPGGEENLPPGAKKGTKIGMINISVIWWNEEGKMLREFEYGRLTPAKFITEPWGDAAMLDRVRWEL